MRHFSFSFLSLLISAMVFFSCRNDKEPVPGPATLTINFKAKWGNDDFHMQQVYYDDFGNRLRIDRFQNYFSTITAVKDDGTEVLIKDFALLNFYEENTVSAEVPAGKYTQLKFNMGIPSAYNKDQDPAQYPSSSVLSVAGSQGMFWSWNTGYIFAKFEGKCDTTGTEGAELLWPVSIHSGDDACFKAYASDPLIINAVAEKTSVVNVNVYVNNILKPATEDEINLAEDAITHTSTDPALAKKFVFNYLNSIVVSQ